MNKHIVKIISDSKDIKNQAWAWYKEQSRTKQVCIAAAIVVVGIGVVSLFGGSNSTQEEVTVSPRTVTVASVSDLANNDSGLPLLGTVTSVSEATIRSESSGKLIRVYKQLGDTVIAGQVIAEFENSAERASVLQAEGAYDAAKAARDLARINQGSATASLSESKSAAVNTVLSVYTTLDDSVRVKTDPLFVDPQTTQPRFSVNTPDSALTLRIEQKRVELEDILKNRSTKNGSLTASSNVAAELNAIEAEAKLVKSFLDDVSLALAKALADTKFSQTQIEASKASINGARSAVNGSLSAIVAARNGLNAAETASQVAGVNYEAVSGGLATSEAQVKQALGSYNAALSRLEKTIIRSPITGTLNSLSIETGDFISAFTEVAVVSNNGALEVVSYVTEDDARRIAVGNEVMIDNTVKGVITRIAQALDPRTKKIEVRVGITEKTGSLVNGQSVRMNITKSKQTVASTTGPIKIPLSALKLTPNGAFVFSVSASSTLVSIPVKEGAILGEEIQILSGLDGSEQLVTDARGLKDGMTVLVKEN
jgi:RND family efflux transporter MFP subunit